MNLRNRRGGLAQQIIRMLGGHRRLLESVLDSLPDLIYVKDLQGRYLLSSAAHRKFIGAASAKDVVGKTVFDFFPEPVAQKYHEDDLQVARSGVPVLNREELLRNAAGEEIWVSTSKIPLRDAHGNIIGILGRGRDITARVRAEQALALERQLVTNLLQSTSDAIYFKDLKSRFIRVSQACAVKFGFERAEQVVGLTDFDVFTAEHAQQAFADEQRIIATGQPLLGIEEKETWPDGHTTWVSTSKMPLRDSQGRIVGTFGISRDITAHKLAEQRAAQYAAQMEAELQMARDMQQALLPQHYPCFPRNASPADSALQFEHRYLPSATLGGDFFDVLQLSDQQAAVIICDVMGHGVRAALITASVRALVAHLTPQAADPTAFMQGLNRGLLATVRRMDTPLFATAFFFVVDVGTGRLLYTSAGHPSALYLNRSADTVTTLTFNGDRSGPALGVFDDPVFPVRECTVKPQDGLLLYTDGVYEVYNEQDEQFGQARFVAATQQRLHQPTRQLLDGLLAEVHQFAGSRPVPDDICLLSMDVRRVGPLET